MARLTGAVLVVLVTFLFLSVLPALAFDRAARETTMLRLINHTRTSRGLAAVEVHAALDKAALAHSRDMIVSRLLRTLVALWCHGGRAGAQRGLLDQRLFALDGGRGDRLGQVVPGDAGGRFQGVDALEFPSADHPGQTLA